MTAVVRDGYQVVPTTEAMVDTALDAAMVAAAEAQVAWRRLQEAQADDVDVDERRLEFEAAQAADGFAWSVYHATRVDWLNGIAGAASTSPSYLEAV